MGYQCPILGTRTDKRFQVQVCERQRPIRSQIKIYLDHLWYIWISPFLHHHPKHYSSVIQDCKAGVIVCSRVRLWILRWGQELTPLLAETFFLLKDNRLEASLKKRKIRILPSFNLRKSKLKALSSQVPQLLGLLSHPELTCCCPSKCISGSVSGPYTGSAATFS